MSFLGVALRREKFAKIALQRCFASIRVTQPYVLDSISKSLKYRTEFIAGRLRFADPELDHQSAKTIAHHIEGFNDFDNQEKLNVTISRLTSRLTIISGDWSCHYASSPNSQALYEEVKKQITINKTIYHPARSSMVILSNAHFASCPSFRAIKEKFGEAPTLDEVSKKEVEIFERFEKNFEKFHDEVMALGFNVHQIMISTGWSPSALSDAAFIYDLAKRSALAQFLELQIEGSESRSHVIGDASTSALVSACWFALQVQKSYNLKCSLTNNFDFSKSCE